MEIYNIHCEFENPIFWNRENETLEPLNSETKDASWNYSEMFCQSDSAEIQLLEIELIENASTGANFFIKKNVSYGDFLIITFLMIFLI